MRLGVGQESVYQKHGISHWHRAREHHGVQVIARAHALSFAQVGGIFVYISKWREVYQKMPKMNSHEYSYIYISTLWIGHDAVNSKTDDHSKALLSSRYIHIQPLRNFKSFLIARQGRTFVCIQIRDLRKPNLKL